MSPRPTGFADPVKGALAVARTSRFRGSRWTGVRLARAAACHA